MADDEVWAKIIARLDVMLEILKRIERQIKTTAPVVKEPETPVRGSFASTDK